MALDFLGPHLGKFRSAIEIGSSVGYLLHRLQSAGVSTVQGLDPAPAAADAGRRLFGVDIQTGYAESFGDYGRYDLVCLRAVLEHLIDPGAILQQIGRRLAVGAHLFIEVPDAGAFDRPEGGADYEPYGEFSNEHINYLAIADVARLAAGAGLEVVSWRSWRLKALPGLHALLRRSDEQRPLPDADPKSVPTRITSAEALTRYLSASELKMKLVERRLAPFAGQDVLIYGAGNHTLRLLARSESLRRCRIRAIIDRNRNFSGLLIGDARIEPPQAVPRLPSVPIIISTFHARREIAAYLRSVTTQPVVSLYD